MVNLKIDKIDVSVPEGTTVMEAAASVGHQDSEPVLSEEYQ